MFSKKVLAFLIPGLVIVFGAGGFLAFKQLSKSDNKNDIQRKQEQGFKQGKCKKGYYESWDGTPPVNGEMRTSCYTKEELEKRKDVDFKPVFFLYSDKDLDFKLSLDFDVQKSFIYPKFNKGHQTWSGRVLAGEDSDILINNKRLDYLFWEGRTNEDYDVKTGNVVARADTVSFLEEALSKMGLNDREIEDFITFWGPRLNENEYNLISFVNQQYEDQHPISISPKPDYSLRLFMVYKSVPVDYQIARQTFQKPATERHGFSLVEWGGTEL